MRLGVEHPAQSDFVERRSPFLQLIQLGGCGRRVASGCFLGQEGRRAAGGSVAAAAPGSLTRSGFFHVQDINHFAGSLFQFLFLRFRFRFRFLGRNFRFQLAGCLALIAVETTNYYLQFNYFNPIST